MSETLLRCSNLAFNHRAWCDHAGSDFHIALAQACRHYIHELNDQQQDERRLIP
jgi:hypothetical protein